MVWTAIVPFARAFYRIEVNYNEGWNVYAASIVNSHQLLYPVKYGWTLVNYPMLSFVVMAQLHRVTHEYLFTARVVSLLSLIACGVLVAAIIRRLGGSVQVSVLGGMYSVAMFCSIAEGYVGMDDPQILALVFFLAGLLAYLWNRRSPWAIAASALLFVVGGSIKHNPIDFPLAVLIDLALISRFRAVWFGICGICFGAIAVALHLHYGGPEFVHELFAPRIYLIDRVQVQFTDLFGRMQLPICVAIYTAFALRKDKSRRIISILFVASIVIGGYFGGGQGVAINCLFSSMMAIAILVGLFWERAKEKGWRFAAYAPAVLFGWLAVPLIHSGNWNPVAQVRKAGVEQRRFDEEVAFLRGTPGPALCESLLRCYFAGKPYRYDPFNATRLIALGKLDGEVMVTSLRNHEYGTVEFEGPLHKDVRLLRFNPAILKAVEENYVVILRNEDGSIYVPKDVDR
jgi:hypothetical protein